MFLQTQTLPHAEALGRIRLLSGKDLRPLRNNQMTNGKSSGRDPALPRSVL
jgi:hypothetical protein